MSDDAPPPPLPKSRSNKMSAARGGCVPTDYVPSFLGMGGAAGPPADALPLPAALPGPATTAPAVAAATATAQDAVTTASAQAAVTTVTAAAAAAVEDSGYAGTAAAAQSAFAGVLEQARGAARGAATSGLDLLLHKALQKVGDRVREAAVADPDMPSVVKRATGRVVDEVWEDVVAYVVTTADETVQSQRGLAETEWSKLSDIGPLWVCSPRWWRGQLLYAYLPFDRSIWGQMRNPLFWLMTALSLYPYWGVRAVYFASLLVLIQAGMPADTYQLCAFIIALKGSQFISSGVVMGLLTAFKYYLCVYPGSRHTCDLYGPGANQSSLHSSIDILGSCAVLWTAFWLLPYSYKYDGTPPPDFFLPPGDEEKPEPAVASLGGATPGYKSVFGRRVRYDSERGGRLSDLMKYDVIVFAISLVAMVCLLCYDYYRWVKLHGTQLSQEERQALGLPDGDDGQASSQRSIRVSLYFARMIYALLCAPFTVFLLPGLVYVLLHVNPTGYNRQGACVPVTMPPVPEEADAGVAAAPQEVDAAGTPQASAALSSSAAAAAAALAPGTQLLSGAAAQGQSWLAAHGIAGNLAGGPAAASAEAQSLLGAAGASPQGVAAEAQSLLGAAAASPLASQAKAWAHRPGFLGGAGPAGH
ncbi:unnamed protein product [Prorocentrum cordatum]|uniref:Glycerophosphocholine acyltransferase 1 n=3 Tax=Prorocentrum cordatum TaxID=2364126 RepID=A0ABN9X388_9DINO|nr:unnamed protein product [Polarella glacialis]